MQGSRITPCYLGDLHGAVSSARSQAAISRTNNVNCVEQEATEAHARVLHKLAPIFVIALRLYG
jgi:hypothetical protein